MSNVQKIKALIIDDNPVFLNVFAKLLEIKGFDVTAETVFKKGLKHLKSKSFPVVFVDTPLENYAEKEILTSFVKNKVFEKSNVFLFSSVDFSDAELDEWQTEGLYSYLKKPVERSTIIKALVDVRAKIDDALEFSRIQNEEATPEQLEKLDFLQKQVLELEHLSNQHVSDKHNVESKKQTSAEFESSITNVAFKNIISDLRSLQSKFESVKQSDGNSFNATDVERDELLKKKLRHSLSELSKLKNEIYSFDKPDTLKSKSDDDLIINTKEPEMTKRA